MHALTHCARTRHSVVWWTRPCRGSRLAAAALFFSFVTMTTTGYGDPYTTWCLQRGPKTGTSSIAVLEAPDR
ncbi:ion channel [Actinoplanes nipponensis]|uniref:ion channel n=1 Tax=Actinoplanes nipponensis TaxID=135950 RepID=UPI0034DB3094